MSYRRDFSIYRKEEVLCQLKIRGAKEKFKNQPRPLQRPRYVNFSQHFWNLCRKTVPLTAEKARIGTDHGLSHIAKIPWQGITCFLQPPAHLPSPLPPPRFCVCLVTNLPVYSLPLSFPCYTGYEGQRLRVEAYPSAVVYCSPWNGSFLGRTWLIERFVMNVFWNLYAAVWRILVRRLCSGFLTSTSLGINPVFVGRGLSLQRQERRVSCVSGTRVTISSASSGSLPPST